MGQNELLNELIAKGIKKEVSYDSFSEFYKENFIDLKENEQTKKCPEFRCKDFIFRGVEQSDYLLTSSFHRWARDKYKNNKEFRLNVKELLFGYEYNFLSEFYNICNYHGMKLPKMDDFGLFGLDNKKEFDDVYGMLGRKWISSELLEFVALAQHYGLPTRMIDWTFDVNVAAYFACVCNNVNKKKEKNFAIWALNKKVITSFLYTQSICGDKNLMPLKFVIPEYSNNPNLCAQKGILTLWQIDLPRETDNSTIFAKDLAFITEGAEVLSLDNLIEQYIKSYEYPALNPPSELVKSFSQMRENPVIYKFIFSAEKVEDALLFLEQNDYLSGRLFPGYKGCFNQLKESMYIHSYEDIINK